SRVVDRQVTPCVPGLTHLPDREIQLLKILGPGEDREHVARSTPERTWKFGSAANLSTPIDELPFALLMTFGESVEPERLLRSGVVPSLDQHRSYRVRVVRQC